MNWFENKRSVVPIDFGDDSKRAVDMALNVVFHPDDLYAVHVATDFLAVEPGVIWDTTDEATRAKNLKEAFNELFSDSKYHGIHFVARFGDPGHKIAEYAEEIGAELIIMPSHGRTGIKRVLIGSVAERVVRLAPCPVLVLRGKSHS